MPRLLAKGAVPRTRSRGDGLSPRGYGLLESSDLSPIFLLVNEEFDSIQVDHPVANDSANADWCDIV